MAVNIRRLFGIVDDIAGGTDFDSLSAGSGGDIKDLPDAEIFWPVTGGDVDAALETLSREDEVRGRRAAVSPLPFRSGPQVTIPSNAYRSVLEKMLVKTLGGADDVTPGPSPAAAVHTLAALGFGDIALPAFTAQIVRDDLNYKVSGCSAQSLAMSFPLDGFGTASMEAWGLYHEPVFEDPPTASFTEVDQPLMLRDAVAYFDPSVEPAAPGAITGTAIVDIQGVDITWTNNLNKKFYAGRNIGVRTLGVGDLSMDRKLWYPTQNKLGAAQDVTFSLTFGNTNQAQEIARDYGQIQKIVIDLTGVPLGTTPDADELVRITIFNGMYTGGGSDALSARNDITTNLQGGAFYSEADSLDVKFEIVNGSDDPIT